MVFSHSSFTEITSNFFSSLIFVLFGLSKVQRMSGGFAKEMGIVGASGMILQILMVTGASAAL
jgi:hypothetical protein